jgi:predicted PurR-regulated permease PerM
MAILKQPIKKLLSKYFSKISKKVTLITVVIVILIASFGAVVITGQLNNTSQPTTTKNNDSPTFETLLPSSLTANELGGWQKLTPPNNEPYYVYVHAIDNVPIKVSQQQLTSDFKNSLDTNIANIAKAYNASDSFTVNNTKVYIGTNSKGPQSVIFSKNGLLILITSDNKIANESWQNYIKSLN